MGITNLFDFTDPNMNITNEIFFADTCFVWQLYGADLSQTQRDCKNFTNSAIQKGSVFVISPKVEEELRNVAVKENLSIEYNKLGLRPSDRKAIINNTPNFMRTVHSRVDEIIKIIESNPNFVRLPQDAKLELAWEISSLDNMDLSDSIILATMKQQDISNIVTLDRDYTKVNSFDLKVFTHNENYLKINQLNNNNKSRG